MPNSAGLPAFLACSLLASICASCGATEVSPTNDVRVATVPRLQEEPDADWPGFRGPAGSGISPETSWTNEGAAAWSKDLGKGYSQASVVGSRLFTRGHDASALEDVTYCLDVATGKELWRHAEPAKVAKEVENMHGGGTLTTPTVADGVVYVVSRLGRLHALEADTGEERWSVDLREAHGIGLGSFGICSSPFLHGGTLFLNVGPTLALDPGTGELRWRSKDYGYSYATPTAFRFEDREYLAVFNGAGLTILDPGDGSEVALHEWTSGYNVNCATPIVVEDLLFISTGYDDRGCALLQFTGDSLELVWENKRMLNKMNGCIYLDGHFYGFHAKELACMNLEGEVLWKERGLGLGTVIAAGERLLVLSEDGMLVVADASPEGFEPLSRERILEEGPCWSTPVLAGGRVFARSQTGDLVCRDHRPNRP